MLPTTPRWLLDIDSIIADANAPLPPAYVRAAPLQRDYLVYTLQLIAERARIDWAQWQWDSEASAQMRAVVDQLDSEHSALQEYYQAALADNDALRLQVAATQRANQQLTGDIEHFTSEIRQLETDIIDQENRHTAEAIDDANTLQAANHELALRRVLDALEGNGGELVEALRNHEALRERFQQAADGLLEVATPPPADPDLTQLLADLQASFDIASESQ